MLRTNKQSVIFVLICLVLLYISWGSSFLFTKLGLQYIPGVTLSGVRAILSGLILLALGIFFQGYHKITWDTIKYSAILGLLQVVVSSGFLSKGQETIPSGLAALLCGTIPLTMVLCEWLFWDGGRPKLKHFLGLALGISSIGYINFGTLFSSNISPIGLSLVILATLAWVYGGHYSKSCCIDNSHYIFQSTGLILLLGGIECIIFGYGVGERWDISLFDYNAFVILTFLVLMSSIVGYTTYLWLLYNVRPAVALSYEYVNPVIALVLGWAFAGEELNAQYIIACAILISSVFLVSSYGKK